jgi:hypothetical protein
LLLTLGYVGHVDEISRRNRRQARHIIDCAKGLGTLKRLIHRMPFLFAVQHEREVQNETSHRRKFLYLAAGAAALPAVLRD